MSISALFILVLVVIVQCVFGNSATAAPVAPAGAWNGGGGSTGSWEDSSMWGQNSVPSDTTNVVISDAFVTVNSATEVNSITLGTQSNAESMLIVKSDLSTLEGIIIAHPATLQIEPTTTSTLRVATQLSVDGSFLMYGTVTVEGIVTLQNYGYMSTSNAQMAFKDSLNFTTSTAYIGTSSLDVYALSNQASNITLVNSNSTLVNSILESRANLIVDTYSNVTFNDATNSKSNLQVTSSSSVVIANSLTSSGDISLTGSNLTASENSTLHVSGSLSIQNNSNAILTQSTNLFTGSTIKIDGSKSNLNIIDSSTTFDSSSVLLATSSSSIKIGNSNNSLSNSTFNVKDNSALKIQDDSNLNLNVQAIFNGNSGVQALGSLVVVGSAQITSFRENSNLDIKDSSTLQIDPLSTLEIKEKSVFSIDGSNLLVHGDLILKTENAINIAGSDVNVGGVLEIQSSKTTTNSTINVSGTINGRNNTEYISSNLNIGGTYLSMATMNLESSNLTVTGSFNLHPSSTGLNTVDSNFKIANGSNVVINNGPVFNLQNSVLEIHGSLELKSVVTLDSKSVIQNHGELVIQTNLTGQGSSVIPTSGGPSTMTAATDTLPTMTTFNNNGQLKAIQTAQPLQLGSITLNNQGLLSLSPQATIFIQQIVSDGEIQMNDQSTLSSANLQLNQGGVLSGLGTIQSNVISTATIGKPTNETSKLLINGNLDLQSGSTIIITINDINDFSTLNVSSNINFGGTLKVRVNQNLIITNVTQFDAFNFGSDSSPSLMSFGTLQQQQQSNFTSIQIVTYDPNSGKETNRPCSSTSRSERSFSVLLGAEFSECAAGDNAPESESKKKLPTTIIIGVVVGVVGAAMLIGGLVFFKGKILNFVKIQKESRKSVNSIKMMRSHL